MATFVFIPFHWAANLNATFAVARRLRRRGHRVCYLGIPDSAKRIRSQGFDATPIFDQVFPEGSVVERCAREARGELLGAQEFRARVRGMCAFLRAGEIERCVRHLSPDLFLVSSLTPWVAMAARRIGLPVVTFSSSLPSIRDPQMPPIGTGLIPRQTLASRLRVRTAWSTLSIRRRLLERDWDISGELVDFARWCDYPSTGLDFRGETWPRLSLPSLVFCPREFDFPRRTVPEEILFVEPSVDTERCEPDFPWHRLADDHPIVYCTLGSVATFKLIPEATQFFQAFMDAMARRPSWQGVVAIGNHLRVEDFVRPANVIIVREAPQVGLLRRAALMVSHGGFGGVKESIYMGVPMLLVPLFYDQPGTAARVVHHGMGVRGRPGKVSARTLGDWMDRVLTDPSYRKRTQSMSATFVALQDRAPSVLILERLARSPRPLDRGATGDRISSSPGPSVAF